jgi:predicted transposase/invertase (TIGR01784 family)
MAQVADKLSILKMTKDERNNYSYYQKKLYNDRDELQAAEARGEARGKSEGKLEIAKKLLGKNNSIEDVSDITGLSISEIEKLKSSLN